jgi:hypothetical protein
MDKTSSEEEGEIQEEKQMLDLNKNKKREKRKRRKANRKSRGQTDHKETNWAFKRLKRDNVQETVPGNLKKQAWMDLTLAVNANKAARDAIRIDSSRLHLEMQKVMKTLTQTTNLTSREDVRKISTDIQRCLKDLNSTQQDIGRYFKDEKKT